MSAHQHFSSHAEVRTLHDRGHAIGSHSATHPYRIGDLPDADLAREWSDSMKALNDIVGSALDSASVPGGILSPSRCQRRSLSADIRHLFTSEPTAQLHTESGIAIYGRYCVYRGMSPATAAGLSAGHLMQTRTPEGCVESQGARQADRRTCLGSRPQHHVPQTSLMPQHRQFLR